MAYLFFSVRLKYCIR